MLLLVELVLRRPSHLVEHAVDAKRPPISQRSNLASGDPGGRSAPIPGCSLYGRHVSRGPLGSMCAYTGITISSRVVGGIEPRPN